MENTKKVPVLRFPDFSDEWEVKKLNDIADLTSSKRVYLSDYVNEGIPFYRGKEISELKRNEKPKDILYITREAYETFKAGFGVPQVNDILITAVGTLGNVYRIKNNSEFYFKDGNLIWLKNVKIFSAFLEILLEINHEAIQKSSIGSTQRALTIIELKKLKFNFPILSEQQKIADFFSQIDNVIEKLTKKKQLLESYKKGVMKKIFNQELRFKDDKGNDYLDWETKELGEILTYEQPTKYLVDSVEYNNKYKTPVLTAGKTFILGYTNEETGIFKNDLPVIIFDDFTKANKFVDFEFKAKSSAMKILKKIDDTVNIKYIYEVMQLITLPSGDEHKRYWISEYQYLTIDLPCIEEQTKIASFLTEIDDKINLVSKQLEGTKQYKKGLLQKMFV